MGGEAMVKTWHQADAKPVTIEDVPTVSYPIDEVITRKDASYQKASLARQLANDEPKCGNCGYWSQARLREEITHVGDCILGSVPKGASLDPLRTITTDLSVCSAWTKK
jgi:hypothetical protein